MKLTDLVQRSTPPGPWLEADNIPWDEPAFSERMLREHLSQHHDRASRRSHRIEQQVRWLHEEVLGAMPSRLLDLACGPGLYTERLAALGHECLGIDFSPASIAHARRAIAGRLLACRYVEGDIRTTDYGRANDLCIFVHGEFNSLRPDDAALVLRRACASLAAEGQIVVEVHSFDAIQRIAEAPPRWYTAAAGLFSDRPHLVLVETFWDAGEHAATERFFVVDLETGGVERHATTGKAYRDEEYRSLFSGAGFRDVVFAPGMGDAEGAHADGLFTVRAVRSRAGAA